MSAPVKFNRSPHCTLCAEALVKARDYAGTSDTRVHVGPSPVPDQRVAVCPVHDVAGPVGSYPRGLLIASGRAEP